ncbi:GGDEF domain-containing protein [Spirilliplanes yamanashiensis]|nr:GGDEF domain-containing protein [Spirilliplanes yamanashiensis]MDP9819869.1 diguanylate cyclase (GGDEF)-like protein [Spirilliplanes yamanashiensis]
MTRPRATRPDGVLAVLAVTGLLYLALAAAGVDGTARVAAPWAAMTVAHALAVAPALRVARTRSAPRAVRRLWGAVAFTAATFLAGDLYQVTVIAAEPRSEAAVWGADPVLYLSSAGTLVLVVVMLSTPLGLGRGRGRGRFRLDIATIMVATATVSVHGTALPDAAGAVAWTVSLVDSVVLGTGTLLLAVYATVKLTFSPAPPFAPLAGRLAGTAAALETVLQILPDSWYLGPHAAWVQAGHVAANLALAAAARVQWRCTAAGPAAAAGSRGRAYSVLPYAAIGVTYALLVWTLADTGLTGEAWIVVGGAIVSTALVVVRQVAAFRHIAELLAERDALAAQLRHQAFHDSLTGLANRALFLERLAAALPAAPAVLLIDLDDFKPVNDRYGHAAGDRLLVEVARRLTAAVRAGDTVARLGGDEFAVIVAGDGAGAVPARVAAALAEPFAVGDTGASIGVAHARPGQSADAVLHEADLAMYAAKARGKGTLVEYAA